jgi:hypothetical protein
VEEPESPRPSCGGWRERHAGCGGGSREDAAADEDLTGRPSPFEQGQAQWPEEEKPYAEKAGERVAEKVAESGFST